jgi:GDPmannose 4,6-dehydratase
MRALVIGITGQDGAYLASSLLKKGYQVTGTSRVADHAGLGNLRRLGVADAVRVVQLDPCQPAAVRSVLAETKANEIYHLAGQSSVGGSFAKPLQTVEGITLGVLNVLQAMHDLGLPSRLFYAGSGECFGDTGDQFADEQTIFRPQSPYAGAKAAAYFFVASYRRAFGLHASTGILFPHESPLRGTQFVTRKIIDGALRIAAGSVERLRLGNLDIERDWGWAPEYVEAMWLMLQRSDPQDLVIATGKSVPLQRFVELAFHAVGLDWREHVDIDAALFRPADPSKCRANPSKARDMIGWKATVHVDDIVHRLLVQK